MGTSLIPFYLYQYYPHPLAPEKVDRSAWILDNGMHYRAVATVRARSSEDAYRRIQEDQGRKRPRSLIELEQGSLQRATLPGDVLLGSGGASMIMADQTIQTITVEMGLEPFKTYYSVSWSPSGQYVAITYVSDDLLIRDVLSEEKKPSYSAPYSASYHRHIHESPYVVAWSPDGSRIASGGYRGEMHIWRVNPCGGYHSASIGSVLICADTEKVSWGTDIRHVAWFPDSSSIIVGRGDGIVMGWGATTGEPFVSERRHQNKILALALAPDGARIATASEDVGVCVWNPHESGEDLIYTQHVSPVVSLDWSPDGRLMVSCDALEWALHLWNARTGELFARLPLSVYTTEPVRMQRVRWSPDGKLIAVSCNNGMVQVFDAFRQQHVLTYLTEGLSGIEVLSWSLDGTLLLTSGSNRWGYKPRMDIWRPANDIAAMNR